MKKNNSSNIRFNLGEIFQQFQKNQIKRKKWIDDYGNVKNIISAVHKNYRIVAAGSKLFSIRNDDTFLDFLIEYLQQIISKSWFRNERERGSGHPLMTWSDSLNSALANLDTGDSEFFNFVPSNKIAAYMNLAYDLFIIDHNHRLQQDIIKRLKISEQFHGARYELFVTAICIRAGLKIEYENERDRRSKHVEFIALDVSTGEQIGIEAKYKIRKAIENDNYTSDKIKIGNITRLINDATSKNPGLPQCIFLELNLPARQSGIILSGKDKFQTMIRQTKQIKKDTNGKDLFNIIFFTNHAPFYDSDDELVSKMDFISMLSLNPKYPLIDQYAITDKITKELTGYSKIPSHFPAES